MLTSLFISRSTFFTIVGIIALVLLVFNPKALWSVIRWCLFIGLSYLIIALKNLVDIYGLLAGIWLSKQSWYFEFFGGLETIVLDSVIVFILALILLPHTFFSKLLAALGGGALCLWNLFHYASFSFIPFGYDPNEEQVINWPFSIVYIVVYALIAWMFLSKGKDDDPSYEPA